MDSNSLKLLYVQDDKPEKILVSNIEKIDLTPPIPPSLNKKLHSPAVLVKNHSFNSQKSQISSKAKSPSSPFQPYDSSNKQKFFPQKPSYLPQKYPIFSPSVNSRFSYEISPRIYKDNIIPFSPFIDTNHSPSFQFLGMNAPSSSVQSTYHPQISNFSPNYQIYGMNTCSHPLSPNMTPSLPNTPISIPNSCVPQSVQSPHHLHHLIPSISPQSQYLTPQPQSLDVLTPTNNVSYTYFFPPPSNIPPGTNPNMVDLKSKTNDTFYSPPPAILCPIPSLIKTNNNTILDPLISHPFQQNTLHTQKKNNFKKTSTTKPHHMKDVLGMSCHQCKLKKGKEFLIFCSKTYPKKLPNSGKRTCKKKFCINCLNRHYHEKIDISSKDISNWICPCCRYTCKCRTCVKNTISLKPNLDFNSSNQFTPEVHIDSNPLPSPSTDLSNMEISIPSISSPAQNFSQ